MGIQAMSGIKPSIHNSQRLLNIATSEVKELSSQSLHVTAFILSLIGGIVIILGSIIAVSLAAFGLPSGTYYGMGPGMMGGYWFGYGSGWFWGLSLVALICGVLVLIGAILLNTRPAEHLSWGTIVLVFSLISFVGMGGYFIGAILGIAGGAIALSYRAPLKSR
jgi:hypothetical protein